MSGRLDPVLVDFVDRSLTRAERSRSVLLIQLNSPGALVGRSALDVLTFRLAHARTPVAVWVGPTGSRAYGGAVRLLRAAAVAGMSPGSRIGRATRPAIGRDPLERRTVGATEARRTHVVDLASPTLGDFIVSLDGRRVGGRTLRTATVDRTGRVPRRRPSGVVSFSKPPLLDRLAHTVASPPVAYLLLIVGLMLMVFEFFTIAVGVAAACGAVALVLSAYGLAVLPTRPVGLALVGVAMIGFAIDVQTAVPRAWTAIAALALALAGANFYRGLSVGILPYVVGVAGALLFMLGAMPGVVRSRFSTPTIGRESMIGEQGIAVGAVNPDGTVRVRGGLWRARTNRATPIPGGDSVRVAAIDGLLLEVEPLEGAARPAGH